LSQKDYCITSETPTEQKKNNNNCQSSRKATKKLQEAIGNRNVLKDKSKVDL